MWKILLSSLTTPLRPYPCKIPNHQEKSISFSNCNDPHTLAKFQHANYMTSFIFLIESNCCPDPQAILCATILGKRKVCYKFQMHSYHAFNPESDSWGQMTYLRKKRQTGGVCLHEVDQDLASSIPFAPPKRPLCVITEYRVRIYP